MRPLLRSAASATLALCLVVGATAPLSAEEATEPAVAEPEVTAEVTAEPEPVPEDLVPGLALVTTAAEDEGEGDDEDDESSVLDISNAQLRWGVNNESNNAAFAPGTHNFFSAGKIADPGRGGVALTEPGWSQKTGNVSIEKWNGTAYAAATWAGLRTDAAGTPINSAMAGRFSGHQLVFDGGSGTLDPDADDARIAWDGDATILYYSGYTFFYVSDPVLEVDGGQARVTATLSGFATSMDDVVSGNPNPKWEPVAPRTATIADLGTVDLKADDRGFTLEPAYEGVDVGHPGQVKSGEGWGSFPSSFIAFQEVAGAAPYWFTSGGSADRFKKPLPLSVSYDATNPVDEEAPPEGGGTDVVDNSFVTPPAGSNVPVSVPVGANVPLSMADATEALAAGGAASSFSPVAQSSTLTALGPDAATALWWWSAIVMLALAAAVAGGAGALARSRPS